MIEMELENKRLVRERTARKEAERLLEEKARELYLANQDLANMADQFKEQVEQIHAILDSTADGILSYDVAGNLQSWNSAALQCFSLATHEAVGMNVRQMFADSDSLSRCLFPQVAVDLLETEQTGLRNNSTFPAEVCARRSTVGEKIWFTAVVRDVTRRKSLESQLSHSKKMESIGQLAAGIAHEINTPIQFINDNLQFLAAAFQSLQMVHSISKQLVSKCRMKSFELELVERIESMCQSADIDFLIDEVKPAIMQSSDGAARVATIVQVLKEFAAPATTSKSAVDLNQLVKNVVLVAQTRWPDEVFWNTELDTSNPQLSCIPSLLNQAFLNIVVNAAEALAGQTRVAPGMILVSTEHDADHAIVRIDDDGPGISPEHLDRIFDPFFTTKPVGQGTGQGLAFVYDAIVNKHQGSVDVQSEPGKGTRFLVKLPLVCPSHDQETDHD